MAFAQPTGLDDAAFERRVRAVCRWFAPLDPFENKGAVLEIEKQNFSAATECQGELEALYCYAVSAKRYALFNHAPGAEPVIRKASGHGLGHLLAPYDDPKRERHSTGVPVWQEDFWREIVQAALAGTPDAVRLDWRQEMSAPAASQYTAAAPIRLRPFRQYNKRRPQTPVWPFNFMLWFQALRPEELAFQGLDVGWTKRMRSPKPNAPYDRDPMQAAGRAFERETGEPVDLQWLKTYERTLRTYVRHPETKFLGGNFGESGPLRRRHVLAGLPVYIGKEADRWEEDEEFGADQRSVVSYGVNEDAREAADTTIRAALVAKGCTHKKLTRAARVSEHTLQRVLDGGGVEQNALTRLARAAEQLRSEAALKAAENEHALETLRKWIEADGLAAVACRLGHRAENLRKVLTGKRKLGSALLSAIRRH